MNREAFESTMKANGVEDFIRYQADGDYISSLVQIAWMVWKARDAEVNALKARVQELEAYECFNCGMEVQI